MKKLKVVILVIFIAFLCAGCGIINASTTRDIRHSGFALSGAELECSFLLSAFRSENVKFLTGNHAITDAGNLYSLSISQKYSNEENCKLAPLSTTITALFDENVVRTSEGKYYSLAAANGAAAYSLIPKTDSNYLIYDIILRDKDVIKVDTADSSAGHYYVLKKDGNVYNYVVKKQADKAAIISNTVVYSKANYGGDIIDFNYAGKTSGTFVRTYTQVFRMSAMNKEECSKYADVACQYEMKLDEGLTKHRNKILGFSGTYLITTYGKQFNATA